MTVGGILDAQADLLGQYLLSMGRKAYSYRQANERVDACEASIRNVWPGMTVGILMDSQPDYLTATVALNRLGCTATLVNSGAQSSLSHARSGQAEILLVDAAHVKDASAVLEKRQLVGVGMPTDDGEKCSYGST